MPDTRSSVTFACPKCNRSPLDGSGIGFDCAGCKTRFPLVGGIPWLFADPTAAHEEWRGRWHFLLRTLEDRERRLRASREKVTADSFTARRLETMADAVRTYRDELGALMQPLELAELTAERTTYLALRTRLPPDQGLATYYANVHRDWCWGDEENQASLALVREGLGAHTAGRTLVLAAGAGRLAYDIHRGCDTELVIALDFNPLLALVGCRLSQGETLGLYEFPTAPLDIAHQAVPRSLKAPEPASTGLDFCLADVHRPPFPPQSFDTIVTPWLVDILPEPFAHLAGRINHLLADGGRWINFGSLSFHSADPADRLSPEECLATLEATGFADVQSRDAELPYLASPASRHARREKVFWWSARKESHVRKPARHEALPDWIVRGKDPVPRLEHFSTQAMATQIHAYILSLIDGRRSIADMAAELEQRRLMPRHEAEASIRQFLITLIDESRRETRY